MSNPNDARAVRPGYWFRPRRFGLGATPVTWQGWAISAGFVVTLLAVMRWVSGPDARVGAAIAITALLIAVAAAKTDGAWRWRWGEDA